jgi:hypothetical protein
MMWKMSLKTVFKVGLCTFGLLLAYAASAAAETPNVVPGLQSWTEDASGGTLTLSSSSRIVYNDPQLEDTAELFAENINELNGMELSIVQSSSPQNGDIYLHLTSGLPNIGNEGYKLTIGNRVEIWGNDVPGVFYGTRTVLQIMKQGGEDRNVLPKGEAIDYPAYRERALMLDTGRKFFTVDFVKLYIEQMAWLKMNVLHLHLSDDQGFRLESNVPNLASPLHYTKADIQELVAYGKRYHVTIIPEIDAPAHTSAITRARPDLLHACPNLRATGDLDLTNPNTIPFYQSLVDEYLPLFEADSFHIGADEYTYFTKSRENQLASLQACPEIMAEAAVRGYSDPGDLYRNFINEMNAYIKSKGKTTRIWEWFDYVGSMPIDTDIILDAWLGENDIQGKSDQGFKLINSSYRYLYIIPGRSVPDRKFLYESWEPWIWTPQPNGRLTNPNDPNLLGAKLHVWNDGLFTPSVPEESMDREISTTMKIFAERIWGSPRLPSYEAFLEKIKPIGNAPGYGFGLLLNYRFENADANRITDESDDGNDGTVYGPVLTTGKYGQGLQFSGGSNRVHIGAPDLGGEWTVSMWVNRQDSSGPAAKLLDSRFYSIRLEQLGTGKVGITVYGKADYSFNYTAPIGQWVHLTFTGDATSTSLYVNGALHQTLNVGIKVPLKYLGSKYHAFLGTIDDLKVFDRKLDASGVQSLYEGRVLHYQFDEPDGVTLTDSSGLGNHAGFKGPERVEGWSGGGLKFNGGDHFAYMSLPDIKGEWTAAMWIKREPSSQAGEVLLNSRDYSIRAKQAGSGKIGITRIGKSDSSFNYTLPTDGTWKHIALVGNNEGTSLYVDGVFQQTLPVVIDLPMQHLGKVGNSLSGVIDSVRVYDRALSAAEITALYASEPAPPPSVALGKPATAELSEPGHGPELAVDHDASNESYWDAALLQSSGKWWQVDLQAVYQLSGIKVRTYVDGTRYYHYKIETSLDGTNWTLAAEKNDNTPASYHGEYYAVNTQARYVRITMTHNSANNSVHLTDVKVYGTL